MDRAANLKKFLLLKQDTMPTTAQSVAFAAAAPPPAPPGEAAPAADQQPGKLGPLPAAVKQAVLDASAGAIERIQAMAIAVGEADTDEAAATPGEISAAFESVANGLVQLAATMKPKPPAPPAPDPAAPPPPAEPPAPPAPPAKKTLDPEVLGELRAVLEAALAMLSGAAAPATDPAQMAEQAKAASARTPSDFAPLLQQMTKFVEAHQAELVKSADMKASIDRLTVQLGTLVSRAVIKTSVPSGNGQPAEKGAGPAPVPAPHWPEDLAVSAKERRNKERGS